MEVKIYFEQERLFNHYVASHPNGDVLQTTNWGRLKAGHGWEYYPLAAEDKGKILASALILIKDLSPFPSNLPTHLGAQSFPRLKHWQPFGKGEPASAAVKGR